MIVLHSSESMNEEHVSLLKPQWMSMGLMFSCIEFNFTFLFALWYQEWSCQTAMYNKAKQLWAIYGKVQLLLNYNTKVFLLIVLSLASILHSTYLHYRLHKKQRVFFFILLYYLTDSCCSIVSRRKQVRDDQENICQHFN